MGISSPTHMLDVNGTVKNVDINTMTSCAVNLVFIIQRLNILCIKRVVTESRETPRGVSPAVEPALDQSIYQELAALHRKPYCVRYSESS